MTEPCRGRGGGGTGGRRERHGASDGWRLVSTGGLAAPPLTPPSSPLLGRDRHSEQITAFGSERVEVYFPVPLYCETFSCGLCGVMAGVARLHSTL